MINSFEQMMKMTPQNRFGILKSVGRFENVERVDCYKFVLARNRDKEWK